jgi:diguanylate cyclase (GGDEF)-like protein
VIYRLREQWALGTGILAATVLPGVGALTAAEAREDRFLGAPGWYWAAGLAMLAIGLAVQMVLNSRAALRRERNLVRTAAQLREVSAELDRLARTDALTGIANRRALFDLLGVEFRRSRRYGRELSVLMVDLDHFKNVNDRWGHPFGDYVLREIAGLISHSVRESDIIGRYGGEEFAVILPETDTERAVVVGEKLRRAAETFEYRHEGTPPAGEPPVRITISVGVASLPVEEDQDEIELIGRADQALYEAKRTGRNRVTVYRKPAASPASSHSGSEAASGEPALPPTADRH